MSRSEGPATGRRAANPAKTLTTVRRAHALVGAFIAPSVLFFTLTGALQLFSFHEAHGAYRPPALLAELGEVHKKQHFEPERPAAPGAARRRPKPERPTPAKELALKWLFLTVAVGLSASTLLGLWMALKHGRDKRLILGLIVAGTVLPILLAVL